MRNRRSIFLYPFSLLYGIVTGFRNFLYNSKILKSCSFNIPVICVGNITVGGTGKTPHTEYLIELLRPHLKVALLSRGYKRKTTGFRFADSFSKVSDIGDEPMQVFRKFPDITIAVDSNRVRGIETILKEKPDTGVILLDDAFQHRRVDPGLSILLSDYERLFINDTLLPYGNLRENARNMKRADIILITKSPENISPIQRRLIVKEINKAAYQNLYFTCVTYKNPVGVFDSNLPEINIPELTSRNNDYKYSQSKSSEDLKKSECGIVLITGIANPQPLYDYLRNRFAEINHLSFSDHHRFNLKDIYKIHSSWNSLKSTVKYIITTEKDAVRLREFTNIAEPLKSSFYYIPVGTDFLNEDRDEFDNLIISYVRKNKRNNRIS